MWKQAILLEYIAQSPMLRRQIDALVAVEQHHAADDDAPSVWALQPRQHVDDGGLAGARRPEQCRDSGVGRERRVNRDAVETPLGAEFD